MFITGIPHPLPITFLSEFIMLVKDKKFKIESILDDGDYLTLKNFWVWAKSLYENTKRKDILEDVFIKSMLSEYIETHPSYPDTSGKIFLIHICPLRKQSIL